MNIRTLTIRVGLMAGLTAVALALFTGLIQISATTADSQIYGTAVAADTITGTQLFTLETVGRYQTGIFDDSAAEILAHDYASQTLYVTNSASKTIDVLDINNPMTITLKRQIPITPYGTGLNSLSFHDGLLAVAIEREVEISGTEVQTNGQVIVVDRQDNVVATFPTGALPDMVTFTPDGSHILVANEGEPSDDYKFDPEGSITAIAISDVLTASTVTQIDFKAFNDGEPRHSELDEAILIYGPNATVAQDLEPEYIAVSPDSKTAWVALQENNAVAVIDLTDYSITAIAHLGVKDHSMMMNAFDASDKDDKINIATWPVYGRYQPDAIASYMAENGKTYIVSANEGDSRDYDGYSEEEKIGKLTLDPTVFPSATELITNTALGRLLVTTAAGDTDNDGDFDKLYSFGARSFSIWKGDGTLVYDSGYDFEQIIAQTNPDNFNANNDDNDSFDKRSDNKGPEPEAVAIGELYGRTYAFIGLERMGGIMMYDVTSPTNPSYVTYFNPRNFDADADTAEALDLAPEDIKFVPAMYSPTGDPLLVVANEVSGTTTVIKLVFNGTQVYLPLISN